MSQDSTIQSLREDLKTILDSSMYNFAQLQMQNVTIPPKPGLYAIYDKTANLLLYVGESCSLRRRLSNDHLKGDRIGSSFRRNLSYWKNFDNEGDISAYIVANCKFQFRQCELITAKRLEHFAIAVLEPLLNR